MAIEVRPGTAPLLATPDRVAQVLDNLLANAVDATRHLPEPEIRIVTRYSFGASLSEFMTTTRTA